MKRKKDFTIFRSSPGVERKTHIVDHLLERSLEYITHFGPSLFLLRTLNKMSWEVINLPKDTCSAGVALRAALQSPPVLGEMTHVHTARQTGRRLGGLRGSERSPPQVPRSPGPGLESPEGGLAK